MSYTSTISIHSLRVEGDKTSTSCAGGKYISIHSLRVEGDLINAMHLNTSKISIHSLRVEGDWYAFVRLFVSGLHFNPLPPCGGRPIRNLHSMIFLTFQSTPSVWRETTTAYGELPVITDFNPLPPCGGRPLFASIRVPHFVFQSTPSVWRETALPKHRERRRPISIHSLRVEGDQMFSFGSQPIKHFNPLPPCGGRRKDSVAMCYIVDISIHSLRVEGDTMAHSKCYGIDISIHSLRVEGDG